MPDRHATKRGIPVRVRRIDLALAFRVHERVHTQRVLGKAETREAITRMIKVRVFPRFVTETACAGPFRLTADEKVLLQRTRVK